MVGTRVWEASRRFSSFRRSGGIPGPLSFRIILIDSLYSTVIVIDRGVGDEAKSPCMMEFSTMGCSVNLGIPK